MFKRIISLTVSLGLLLQQTVFAYTASLNLSAYLNPGPNLAVSDRFRPVSLRYFSYQPLTNDFKVLLDKGDTKDIADTNLKGSASVLLDYFKIGLSLPNDKFWVNLRPDSRDEIIDQELAKTDLGKVMLEADLKLKQDTSLFTSPSTPQGKEYWNKLYKKAGELFGTENITIPTLTRPWIVPGEIILRESNDKSSQGAYIYKANLKVMLEEDYLKSSQLSAISSQQYEFNDPRLKELNQYSTQLIRELILPRLTQKVNSSKDYANLRQVYFSLILARWFKETFNSQPTVNSSENNDSYVKLINSNNLTNLTSKTPWDKTTYFNAYQKSFQEGEYNLSEPIYTPTGQVIRRYMSGGISDLMPQSLKANGAGIYVGGPDDNIASSAIMRPATQVFFTEKELSQKQFIDSKKSALDIFYPIDSGLTRLTDYAVKFNDILGVNKSFLNEEEKGSLDNLLKRIRENREQVNAIRDELKEIPEGAAEPLSSLGAAWKILNKTQAFLIDEAKSLSKIINSIQPLIGYEKGKYLNSSKEALEAIIKNLSGRVLLIREINSEKENLSHFLDNMKKQTVVIDAKCLLSYVDGHTNDTNIVIRFNKNGDISLFSKDNTPGYPILKFKLGLREPKEIETESYSWERKIDDLSPEGAYNLAGAIKDALERANSVSSAVEASKKTEGPAIIFAVKSLQDKLPDNGNEQLLKFTANVNPNGELEYPIKKDDNVMIGHVRGDRAGYLALGLQARGFEKLLGYIKFDKDFKGVSVLPEEAVGKISNTFFEILSSLGYTTARISEDEKKDHVGPNANGRDEQPFPGERRVIIKMQKSSMAYVDTPEMRMKEVADAVLAELDGNVDFILTNFLSSDMMKHTGNFEAAKKSNEITDQQLGRIKERIDAIKEAVLEEMQDAVNHRIPESEEKIHLLRLLTDNYDKFLRIVSKKYSDVLYTIKMFEKEIPLLVITADHGASETGLKENPKESDTFHSANPVPYVIYDPLRKQKVPLKEGKTIRNNAATLLQLLGEKVPKEYDESLLPADYQGSKRRIAFAVLDGWGINPDQSYPHDAIRLADTPNYDWFVKNASFTQLAAHGEVIGLRKILSYEEGPHHLRGLQAGQTDIGHIHLFSGREVKQPLWYMDQLILGGLSNGVFDETKEEVKLLIRELSKVKEKGSKFHYITVGSEGGVHASLYHMYALMRLAKKVGLGKDQFVIHFAADGRDVPTRTAHLYLEDVYKIIEEIGIGVVSVVFGRDMLVRKEGAENITNRLIDVLSGDNLKDDDVTLVKETPQGRTTSGSPLTVEDLRKIEWGNVLFDSLREIFEERFRRINEYHGKLFVMEKFLDQFITARYDKNKIRVIKDAIEAARLYWEAPSEIEQANRKELRVFLTESLDSYCQKILSEIKEAFSDSKLKFLSNDVSAATADRKKKRDFLLKQINEIEAYYFGKKGPDIDYRGAHTMPGRLNWAIRIHKMMQYDVSIYNILEQFVPNTSSAIMSMAASAQANRPDSNNLSTDKTSSPVQPFLTPAEFGELVKQGQVEPHGAVYSEELMLMLKNGTSIVGLFKKIEGDFLFYQTGDRFFASNIEKLDMNVIESITLIDKIPDDVLRSGLDFRNSQEKLRKIFSKTKIIFVGLEDNPWHDNFFNLVVNYQAQASKEGKITDVIIPGYESDPRVEIGTQAGLNILTVGSHPNTSDYQKVIQSMLDQNPHAKIVVYAQKEFVAKQQFMPKGYQQDNLYDFFSKGYQVYSLSTKRGLKDGDSQYLDSLGSLAARLRVGITGDALIDLENSTLGKTLTFHYTQRTGRGDSNEVTFRTADFFDAYLVRPAQPWGGLQVFGDHTTELLAQLDDQRKEILTLFGTEGERRLAVAAMLLKDKTTTPLRPIISGFWIEPGVTLEQVNSFIDGLAENDPWRSGLGLRLTNETAAKTLDILKPTGGESPTAPIKMDSLMFGDGHNYYLAMAVYPKQVSPGSTATIAVYADVQMSNLRLHYGFDASRNSGAWQRVDDRPFAEVDSDKPGLRKYYTYIPVPQDVTEVNLMPVDRFGNSIKDTMGKDLAIIVSSALAQTEKPEIVGGIDFRQMNMLIQPQGSFASSSLDFSLPALSKAEIESFDLDTELAAIQRMASSGIAPSYQRLKEYLAVCFAKERTGKEIDSLKLCLLDIFEKEQFEAKETPNGYKEVLVIADTKGYVLRESRLAGRGQNSYSLN